MKVEPQNLQRLTEENKVLLQENHHLYDQITKLLKLQESSVAITSSLSLDVVSAGVVRAAVELVMASMSRLFLINASSGELIYHTGWPEEICAPKCRALRMNETLVGWVATYGKPVIIDDISKDRRFSPEVEGPCSLPIDSIACVPLVVKERTIGVLDVCNKVDGRFDYDDLDSLSVLAKQAAVAMENARFYQMARDEKNMLQVLQEDIRKKLARDLHDGPAQALAAITMNIDYVKKLLTKNSDAVTDELESLRTLSSRTMREVRNLLFELRPLMMETQGLLPTLQSLVNRLQEPGGPKLHLSAGEADVKRLDRSTEMYIFAIVQEAINNTLKHARAKNIWVDVAVQGKALLVTVKDDGSGFDLDKVQANYESRGSLGLVNMRERASLVGGTLVMKSSPGHGTTVLLQIPVS